MKRIIYLLLLLPLLTYADTMGNFMNIANNIPKMEMKADPKSQAWSRSARNILILASESIAESLLLANETAAAKGQPLFCMPAGTQLNAEKLNELIQKTYRDISSQQSDKDKMTVSQVALMGLTKKYPCQQQHAANSFQQHQANNRNSDSNPFNHTAGTMQHQSAS